ncbi:hypothetical protein D3C78_1169870 [compost metagenome]
MGSNTGRAISNGSTTLNHWASATLWKSIRPMEAVAMPPITMPSSTEMLAMKPLPKREISRMDSSTRAEMPTPVRSP